MFQLRSKEVHTRIPVTHRTAKITGPKFSLYYPNIRTTFFPINKNNSFPIEVNLATYDKVLYEVDPDQIPRQSKLNFAVIRNPYTRSISLADSLYFCDLQEKRPNVKTSMYSRIDDTKITNRLWKKWARFWKEEFGYYDKVAIGHLGTQVSSLPKQEKIYLITFEEMYRIPEIIQKHLNHIPKKFMKPLCKNLSNVCTKPWTYDLEKYPNVKEFTETYYGEDVKLWNAIKDKGVVESCLDDLHLSYR